MGLATAIGLGLGWDCGRAGKSDWVAAAGSKRFEISLANLALLLRLSFLLRHSPKHTNTTTQYNQNSNWIFRLSLCGVCCI